MQNVFNEEDLDLLYEDVVKDNYFEKSEIHTEASESIEELKYPS